MCQDSGSHVVGTPDGRTVGVSVHTGEQSATSFVQLLSYDTNGSLVDWSTISFSESATVVDHLAASASGRILVAGAHGWMPDQEFVHEVDSTLGYVSSITAGQWGLGSGAVINYAVPIGDEDFMVFGPSVLLRGTFNDQLVWSTPVNANANYFIDVGTNGVIVAAKGENLVGAYDEDGVVQWETSGEMASIGPADEVYVLQEGGGTVQRLAGADGSLECEFVVGGAVERIDVDNLGFLIILADDEIRKYAP